MKEENKMKNFIMIPKEFMKNRNLTKTDCFLFGHIYSLSQKEGYCYSPNSKLISQSFIKIRTLNYSLKRLEQNGYIKIVRVRNKDRIQRRIYITEKMQNSSN